MLNYNNNRNRNEQFDANELCIKKLIKNSF